MHCTTGLTALGFLSSGGCQVCRRDANNGYCRHRPEDTLLYQVVEHYYPRFAALRAEQGRASPAFLQREFEEYRKCGQLEHGFLRVRCSECHAEKLVAFSRKRRGFCPSCGARRMVDSAALLVDEVLPHVPIRQWVHSVPFPIRFLFACQPQMLSAVLRIVVRAISGHFLLKAGSNRPGAETDPGRDRQGAELVTGGPGRPEGMERGYHAKPTCSRTCPMT